MKRLTFLKAAALIVLPAGAFVPSAPPSFLLQQTDVFSSLCGPVGHGRSTCIGDPDLIGVRNEMAAKRNAGRHESLVRDAQQLLRVAGELSTMVAAGDQGGISPETIKKAEQVENLAKQVRLRMAGE